MIVSLLVAADEDNLIGKDNQLPWHLPDDLRYFKNQTWGMPILMGRKTFDAIGKALPGRKSIVITRNQSWSVPGVAVVHSLGEAISEARRGGALEIFVIGGAEIFRSAFDQADRIYLTRIHSRFSGDAYFPELPSDSWRLSKDRFCAADAKNPFDHSFQVWERINTQS